MAHVIKKGSIKVPTQPKDYDLQATGLVFKSYDNQIALEFNVEQQNGTPADLLGANLRLLMFIYDEVDGMITKEPIPFITKNLITESFLNGQVVYILPEAMKAYNGMVEAYVYIEYPDGSTSDNLGFTFRMKRSAIDGLAQDKADYFIADFQQLLDGVKQKVDQKITESETQIDAKVKDTNDKITKANQDVATLDQNLTELRNDMKLSEAWAWSKDGTDRFTTVYPRENLFAPIKYDSNVGYIRFDDGTGKTIVGSGSYRYSDYIDVTGTVVVMNIIETTTESPVGFRIFAYDTDQNFLGNSIQISFDHPRKETWTLPENTAYIRYYYPKKTGYKAKLEIGDTPTIYTPAPSEDPINAYPQYRGVALLPSDLPDDYSWDVTPEYTEKGLNDSVSSTEPETILGLKNFAEGLQSSGVNVAVEYAKAIDTDKYTKHGAIYLGGCAWLAWETLTFQKTEGYAKGSYIRLGADGNASFTYSDVPNIFGGYLWLGGVCQPEYTDGGFGSYHITVENNFDDARKPIVRFIDSPTTPVKKLAVRGFALVFAPAPTENSQVEE